MVKSVHECLDLLEAEKHVYTMQLQPRFVGASPLNRDDSGVSPVDVRELLPDILTAGFLESKVIAVGVEPSSAADLAWNQRFLASTGGCLEEVDCGVGGSWSKAVQL